MLLHQAVTVDAWQLKEAVMKLHPHDVRIVNLALVLLCLLSGVASQIITSAKAQVTCEYPNLAQTPSSLAGRAKRR